MSHAHPLRGHIDSPPRNADGRRQARRALRLETSGSLTDREGAARQANVTVHNISAAGLLIETVLPLTVGEVLSLDLPRVGAVGAEIVWESGQLFGCAFEQALGEAALAAAQLRGTSAVIGQPAAPVASQSLEPSPFAGVSLGTRINRLRRERAMTLAQVAEALGVSKPTVWAWEKDKARPIPDRIARIAEVLGVAPSELEDAGRQGPGSELVEQCRERLAVAYGVDPRAIRIAIEI